MPPVQPTNLEELLERLGSSETPIDVRHRYALRRALLNSPYFESHQTSQKWSRIFSQISTVLVGGMAVTIVVVSLQIVFSFPPAGSSTTIILAEAPIAGPTVASAVPAPVEVKVVSHPLQYLNTSDIPQVVPAHIMRFMDSDLNFVTTR